jgi:hypothetical protein
MAASQPQFAVQTSRLDVCVWPRIPEEDESDGDEPCQALDEDDLIDQEMDRLRHAVQKAQSGLKSPRPHIRLQCNDESLRDRFCANARRLLDSLDAPDTESASVQIARRALRYRKITNRLEEIDPHNPAFDVSRFFGVEWGRPRTCASAD